MGKSSYTDYTGKDSYRDYIRLVWVYTVPQIIQSKEDFIYRMGKSSYTDYTGKIRIEITRRLNIEITSPYRLYDT